MTLIKETINKPKTTSTEKVKTPRQEVKEQRYGVLDQMSHGAVLWYFTKRDRIFLLWVGLLGSNALWLVQYVK